MKILAVDGALDAFSAAVWDGTTMHVTACVGGDALEFGLRAVDELLARVRTPLATLDRLAVGIGPGSFTGVRIALSFAKAIAQARALPLCAFSSYDLLTPEDAPLPVLAVVRGRTGIVAARLREETGSRTASGPPDEVVAALLADIRGHTVTVVGNTEDVRSAIAERGIVVRALPRRAENPAAAAAQLTLTSAPHPTPHAVAPEYGELPAVTVRTRT